MTVHTADRLTRPEVTAPTTQRDDLDLVLIVTVGAAVAAALLGAAVLVAEWAMAHPGDAAAVGVAGLGIAAIVAGLVGVGRRA